MGFKKGMILVGIACCVGTGLLGCSPLANTSSEEKQNQMGVVNRGHVYQISLKQSSLRFDVEFLDQPQKDQPARIRVRAYNSKTSQSLDSASWDQVIFRLGEPHYHCDGCFAVLSSSNDGSDERGYFREFVLSDMNEAGNWTLRATRMSGNQVIDDEKLLFNVE